ncbi:MAG: hypothetical protein DDT33_01641 [Firmicutes bacterium]|nr:hypothetical protein [Bacillota bacterium]
MAINDGQSGFCRACGVHHLMDSVTICTDCVRWTLVQAADAETVSEALEVIKKMLLE